MPDPPHREHNNYGKALSGAGQSYLRTDGAFLGNAFTGPWGANANLDTIQESWRRLMATISIADKLFVAKYDRLARDLNNGLLPLDHGTDHGMERILDEMKEHVWKKGARVQLSRWFRWVDRVEPLVNDFALLEFILSDIGLY